MYAVLYGITELFIFMQVCSSFLLVQNEVFKIDNCDPMQVIMQCMTLDTILYNMFIIHSKIIESDNFTTHSSA